MKKFLFLLIIIAGASRAEAQQQTVKPGDPLLFKAPRSFNGFKLNDSTLFKNYFSTPKQDPMTLLNSLRTSKTDEIFYSTMPVVKLESTDNIAIIRPGNSNEHYTMLIKRLKVVDPLKQQLVSP
jgi:hypothetical protein